MKQLPPVSGFLWAIASLALAAGIYAGYRAAPGFDPFVLHTVRVEGAGRSAPEAIIRAAGIETGTSLLSIDMDRVRRGVESLPWVRDARVVRQVPGTLRIELQEWVPAFLVRMDEFHYMTREGHLISAPLDQGLDFPVITGLGRSDLEGDGSSRRALLEALDAVDRGLVGEELSEIHCSPATGITLYTPQDGGTALALGWSEYEEKLHRLARLRRHLRDRRQSAYAVNLTYQDRIIARLTPASEKSQ